jgi:hypothetical protein
VVVNLSSWARRRMPLAAWLVEELVDGYDVPQPIARAWVRDREILPLLDGLDEVAEEVRGACVATINDFQRHHLVELVVCSRSEEYRALTTRLRVEEAVVLQPPTRAQVNTYLKALGVGTASGGRAAEADEDLWELLQSPLMLSIVALTYSGRPAAALLERGSVQERRDRLFAAYTEQMFARRPLSGGYADQQGIRWLAWLARSMHLRSQSEFHLDRMQPDWLSVKARQRLVTLGAALMVGFGLGLTFLLLIGFGLFGDLEVASPSIVFADEYFTTGGFRAGLVFALVYGSVAGLLAALAPGAIQPVEEVRWSWAQVRRTGWKQILVAGLVGGFLFGLLIGFGEGLAHGLVHGLIVGMVVGLVGMLFVGLVPGLVEDRVVPNEGIRRSARHGVTAGLLAWFVVVLPSELAGGYSDQVDLVAIGLAVGLAGGLIDERADASQPNRHSGHRFRGGLLIGLASGLTGGVTGGLLGGLVFGLVARRVSPNQAIRRVAGPAIAGGLIGGVVGGFATLLFLFADGDRAFEPVAGLFVGVVAWLHFGGRASVRHLMLRVLLALERAAPWRFVQFLDDATSRLFLRRSGSAHLFVHRLLLEYFAQLEAEHPLPGKATQPQQHATDLEP